MPDGVSVYLPHFQGFTLVSQRILIYLSKHLTFYEIDDGFSHLYTNNLLLRFQQGLQFKGFITLYPESAYKMLGTIGAMAKYERIAVYDLFYEMFLKLLASNSSSASTRFVANDNDFVCIIESKGLGQECVDYLACNLKHDSEMTVFVHPVLAKRNKYKSFNSRTVIMYESFDFNCTFPKLYAQLASYSNARIYFGSTSVYLYLVHLFPSLCFSAFTYLVEKRLLDQERLSFDLGYLRSRSVRSILL